MADMMTFPDTVEEFMESYKVVDTDGIYMSKGAELVPIFRMKQWFEHLQPAIIKCQDCKHKPSGSGANHDISFPDEVCPCQCEDYWYSWMPKDDWYCGSWERRTDGQTD